MVTYRRNRLPGGTYFFTVTLRNRDATTLTDHIDALRQAFRSTRNKYPFTLDAVVILPDHLHTIWTLPLKDDDYPTRWRSLKSLFVRALKKRGIPLSRDAKGEYALWQRRYWEHTIRDSEDLSRHMDYIHYNPVKHGLVKRARDWPHSSFHRWVESGVYDLDWGGPEPLEEEGYGE
ncbi:REP-associated tyrosine transposase [Microbulbifer litoralis]|uniref:REP-associated tyrosine transposase n=1 Tax=Microbulbifer litoralis TaxID=2933965 RepID=UPI00202795C0|nr:transposase [Microbulbifer sp. GX H0434]